MGKYKKGAWARVVGGIVLHEQEESEPGIMSCLAVYGDSLVRIEEHLWLAGSLRVSSKWGNRVYDAIVDLHEVQVLSAKESQLLELLHD